MRLYSGVRPRIIDQEIARDWLLDHLEDSGYEYLHDHEEIIDCAFVFVCSKGDDIAGFIWFYQCESDEHSWVVHISVVPGYHNKFFSRTLVNTIFASCYALGCNEIVAENTSKDILARMGGLPNADDGVTLNLPAVWR